MKLLSGISRTGWIEFICYIIQLDMYFSQFRNNTSWTIHKTDRYIDNKKSEQVKISTPLRSERGKSNKPVQIYILTRQ